MKAKPENALALVPTANPAAGIEESAREMVAHLQRLGEEIEVFLPDDTDVLWESAIGNLNRSVFLLAMAGAQFAKLKAMLPYGEFGKELNARRIPARRAQEAMLLAKLLMHPIAKKYDLFRLPKAKLDILASVEVDLLEQLHESGQFDLIEDVDLMPRDMIREKIQQLERSNARLCERVASQDVELQERRYATGAAAAGSELPAAVTRARAEAAALADRALAEMAALGRQGSAMLAAPDLGATRAESARNLSEGARSILLHAASVLATAAEVYASLRAELGEWLPPNWDDLACQPDPLTLAEAHQLAQWREVHVRRQEQEAALREQRRLREGEIRRGPGRPRGSTNAKKKRKRGRPRKSG